jgi:formylmethanofuran dehydrogenase subunit A
VLRRFQTAFPERSLQWLTGLTSALTVAGQWRNLTAFPTPGEFVNYILIVLLVSAEEKEIRITRCDASIGANHGRNLFQLFRAIQPAHPARLAVPVQPDKELRPT